MNRPAVFVLVLFPFVASACADHPPREAGEAPASGASSPTPNTPTFPEFAVTEDLPSGGHRHLRIRGLVVGTLRAAGSLRVCRAVASPTNPFASLDCIENAALAVRRVGRLCDTSDNACIVQPSSDGTYALLNGSVAAGRAACGAIADSQPCFRFELTIILSRAAREPTFFLESVPADVTTGAVAYGGHSCGFTPSTGYTACDSVLRHWISRGGSSVLGDPTSDERMEVSKDGKHRRAQWFRGARLEIDSSSRGALSTCSAARV